MSDRVGVLFVCLGNICRSPTAHGVFEAQVASAGLADRVWIDSAGTGAWHVGEAPDSRATAAALERGYHLEHLRARQVSREDFQRFDYLLAMDRQNLQVLNSLAPADARARPRLFLEFARRSESREVPDPYYGVDGGFQHVLDLVEDACEGLLLDIRERYL